MIIFSVNRRTPATYYILTLSIDSLFLSLSFNAVTSSCLQCCCGHGKAIEAVVVRLEPNYAVETGKSVCSGQGDHTIYQRQSYGGRERE